MKLPILVNEHGDVSSYGSVAEAEASLEPIDVERNEYVVTDADGQELVVKVVLEDKSLFWGLWKTRLKKVRIASPNEIAERRLAP